ncbi:hypothetical protein D3C80_1342700 [compost metagenome]
MIVAAKAWVKERASAIIVVTAIAIVLLMIFTGWIIDFFLCLCLLGLLRLAIWLGKR